jgi:pimeloyl-ACP methyl ester carboxylesterase
MSVQEEFITLETATGNIYGTLTRPAGDEHERIVLIISDSGPTDRDGNSPMLAGKNDCLKMLAVALAEQGIASVRYDKRGVAESLPAAPREIDLRIEYYVQDTVEWVQMLEREYGYAQISLVGHGEGALISALAAQLYPVTSLISIGKGAGRSATSVIRTPTG